MWPASHSSDSRTSTRTTPLPRCSRTSDGSTSSTWLRIFRMTSAPVGLIEITRSRSGFKASESIARPKPKAGRFGAAASAPSRSANSSESVCGRATSVPSSQRLASVALSGANSTSARQRPGRRSAGLSDAAGSLVVISMSARAPSPSSPSVRLRSWVIPLARPASKRASAPASSSTSSRQRSIVVPLEHVEQVARVGRQQRIGVEDAVRRAPRPPRARQRTQRVRLPRARHPVPQQQAAALGLADAA